MRRKVMSVIGLGSPLAAEVEPAVRELGRLAVEAGFRIVCGGLGGAMEAIARGAREAGAYREGDVVGILPGYEASAANDAVDIAVPTGLGIARNVLVVATGDVVVIVGGGAGTLGEIGIAWQLGKPLVAFEPAGGWGARFAGDRIDDRRTDTVERAATPAEAVAKALARCS
jgi:uncharacterized protein (TIGR00725 family)